MLRFNAGRVLNLRGVERFYTYLIKIGFTHMTASNIANGNIAAIKIAHLQRLCYALNCTPNDLFEWIPETGGWAISDEHSLNALRHDRQKGVREIMKNIPLERLGEVEEFLAGMKETTN